MPSIWLCNQVALPEWTEFMTYDPKTLDPHRGFTLREGSQGRQVCRPALELWNPSRFKQCWIHAQRWLNVCLIAAKLQNVASCCSAGILLDQRLILAGKCKDVASCLLDRWLLVSGSGSDC